METVSGESSNTVAIDIGTTTVFAKINRSHCTAENSVMNDLFNMSPTFLTSHSMMHFLIVNHEVYE